MCHGLVYHQAGQLFPDDPENAKFAQQYIYDADVSLPSMLERNPTMKKATLQQLQTMMERVSPYVARYRTMRDLTQTEGASTMLLGFVASKSPDPRRYNLPLTIAPAAVFVGEEGAPQQDRDIVIWPRDYPTHRVSELNEHVDALAYPLLFPYGDQGWTPYLKHAEGCRTKTYTRVTTMQFYSHRLMLRPYPEPNPHGETNLLPHAAGALFQQYVCDMYSKAEAQRLAWVKMNQKELRAEEYTGLYDAVHNQKEEAPDKVGARVVLPSSYPGCPRSMNQNYMDAMCIVRAFGKPDFFITMTANPKWQEVTENLRGQETAHNRPDLVARIFHIKFRELMKDLLQADVLGKVVGYTWVIEFQKRGLPFCSQIPC